MGSGPAVLSFICCAILAIFILIRRIRENVAKLALLAWLLGCNLVHGINASIWSSDVDIKAVGWCDLVTKLVLATTIAVPATCLCISRYLEMVSSTRKLPASQKAFRNRRIFDAILCYLIPFIYMPLHIIGQDQRFNLMEGFGCMASVHPSSAASAVVWLPPIVMCLLSLVSSGMAVHNSFRHPSTHFSTHLESRCTMTSSIWSRTLAMSMTLTAATTLVLLFSMFSLSMSDAWISWQHVHQHLSEVRIVGEADQLAGGIKTFWWGLRVITLCYIVLVLALGEEGRDIFRYLGGAKKFSFNFVWPWRRNRDDKVFPNPPSLDKPPRPLTLELRSGWDDDLDIKSSGLSRLSPKSWKKGGRSSPPSSPSPVPSSKTFDDGYVASSMPYLSSTMTASPFGFTTPVVPPPVYQSSKKTPRTYDDVDDLEARLLPTSPIPPTRPLVPKSRHKHHAESKASNIITVLDEQWPEPPVAIPSPIPHDMTTAMTEEVSPTRASSPALSIDERRQPCSYMTSSTPQLSRPFEDLVQPSSSQVPPTPRTTKRSLTRRPSLQSIRSLLGKERSGQPGNEMIHMTVVRETETV